MMIEVKDLSYSYPDGTPALEGVSFEVRSGESVAVVGENGAGKSTLLLHLNGTFAGESGDVVVNGTRVDRSTFKAVRRMVGVVFQDPDDQLFMPVVGDDVAFGPVNLGLSPEEVERRVVEALSKVGALGLRDRHPHRLSAGEKRAVAIASVLSMNPAVLVMDEPTSSLDPRGRRTLIGLLKTFTHTKIVATHDLDFVLDLCERTIVLHRGRVLADGSTAEIFQNDALLKESRLERPLRMQGCPLHGSPRNVPRGVSRKQAQKSKRTNPRGKNPQAGGVR
jgi:cobalt/nickel transport system ATP-binding protein